MRIKSLLFLVLTAMSWMSATGQQTDSIPGLEPVDSIAVPIAEPEAVQPETTPEEAAEAPLPALTLSTGIEDYSVLSNGYMDRISPKYGFYTPAKEFSFTPIPLVLSGFLAKASKRDFRRARVDFEPTFHKRFDDYIQYIPLATAWGMRAFGVEGRSNWPRFIVSNVFSAAMMATIVNGVKYSVKEMRPDGSTRNSFPSGHTATAFMAATILHKEYGLTRSSWYSVGAYAVATTTGVMRSLNNRHWISDILVGAGIGVISTDLGYLFADLIFKDKGIVRTDRVGLSDIRRNPSFISGSLSISRPFGDLPVGDNVMEAVQEQLPYIQGLTRDHLLSPRLKLGTATTVNAEGAYFINPYLGFGGHIDVTTMPVRADNLNVYQVTVRTPDGSEVVPNPASVPGGIEDGAAMLKYFNPNNQHSYTLYPGHEFMQSVDNLPIFTAEVGVFGQLPVSRRCAFGAKLLMGRRIAGSCDLDSYSGIIKDKYLNGDFNFDNLDLNNEDDREYWRAVSSTAYESIDLDVKNSFVFTTGLSFTVMLRQNMGCKAYVDYSNSRFNYDLTYLRADMPALVSQLLVDENAPIEESIMYATSSHKRGLNTITGGITIELHF